MDIHKSSWNLGIHLNDMFVRNVHQKPNPSIMANYLKQHYPGANYKAAYEAGKFGFGYNGSSPFWALNAWW